MIDRFPVVLPSYFNAEGLVEIQREAVSKDGTKVPYFIVMKKDLKMDGKNPTLLYGYGGFLISLLPSYAAVTGACWLQNGGVYVSANIRCERTTYYIVQPYD
jgi:prolyl oligopeptidase